MHRPDRVPVGDALDVVPHPVAVDHRRRRPRSVMPIIRPSTCAGTPESMRAGGGAEPRRPASRTRSWLPPIPPEVTITACARNSNSPAAVRDDGVAARRRRSARGWCPDTPSTAPSGDGERVDPVPEPELDEPGLGRRPDPPLERLDDPGPGAPGDVEPRHAVAGAAGVVAAALGPADDRDDASAPWRRARRASPRRPTRRRPWPTGAATRLPAGRSPPCRASPARPGPAESRDAAAAAARASRRRTARRTTTTPARRGTARAPGRASSTRRPASAASAAATRPASPAPTTITSASTLTSCLKSKYRIIPNDRVLRPARIITAPVAVAPCGRFLLLSRGGRRPVRIRSRTSPSAARSAGGSSARAMARLASVSIAMSSRARARTGTASRSPVSRSAASHSSRMLRP